MNSKRNILLIMNLIAELSDSSCQLWRKISKFDVKFQVYHFSLIKCKTGSFLHFATIYYVQLNKINQMLRYLMIRYRSLKLYVFSFYEIICSVYIKLLEGFDVKIFYNIHFSAFDDIMCKVNVILFNTIIAKVLCMFIFVIN